VHFINNGKHCLYRIYVFAPPTVVSMYTLPKGRKDLCHTDVSPSYVWYFQYGAFKPTLLFVKVE